MEKISNQRLGITVGTICVLALWFFYPKREHLDAWALRILAMACMLTTLALWSNWRHRLFSIPFLILTCAVAWLLNSDYNNSPLDWILAVGPAVYFLYLALQSWKRAVAAKHVRDDSRAVGINS